MVKSRVTIARTMPIVTAGIRATLEATEFEVVAVDESRLVEWASDGGIVILEVGGRDELELVAELRRGAPHAHIIAIVAKSPNGLIREALGAGATSSIPLGNDIESIVIALRAAQVQLAVLPEAVGRALADAPVPDSTLVLEPAQKRWLEQLAAGVTVDQIASEAGYSPRAMYRLLNDVYAKLGVEGRVAALVVAARHGLI